MMPEGLTNEQLLKNTSALLENARNKVVVAVNQTRLCTRFEIGRMMVKEEQKGESRAEYNQPVLKDLSLQLTKRFGKGFSENNLQQMRQFFLSYSYGQILSDKSESVYNIIQQTPLININRSRSHHYNRGKRSEDKSKALVRYTLPENNEPFFAGKYSVLLPGKQDFINILNSDNGKIS